MTPPKTYYVQIINDDDVSFDELVDLISKVCNLNYGEVLVALDILIEIIRIQLCHARQVHLNFLGAFFLK